MRNQRKRKGSASPYRGVQERINRKGIRKYYAKITINYIQKHIGTYETAEDARDAYNKYIEAKGLV